MITVRQFIRGCSTDWRSSYSFEKARDYLNKFAGGSIALNKDDKSGVARLLIEHKGKKNAFSGKMMVDLSKAIDELENWKEGRVVVVEGDGEDFCSGADLNFVQQIANANDGFMMNTFMGTNLRRLRSLPIVSIANGHGFVLGGATEMYASCDIRAAKKGTKIGFVQARMGISPGWAGASRIVEAIGRAKAIEVLAASSTFSADDAKAMGFVDFLYDERDEFEKYLSRFSKNSVGAIRSCKEMINAVCEAHSMEDKHMVERDVFIQVWGGPDNMAALSKNIKHK